MTCPLCNDTGEQRYWEGRWRDEKADNERLRALLNNKDYIRYKADYNKGHLSWANWLNEQERGLAQPINQQKPGSALWSRGEILTREDVNQQQASSPQDSKG